MNYESLAAAIQQLTAGAGEERLRGFGAETVDRLAQDTVQPGVVSKGELDDNARPALADACQRVLTATPSELRALLARIDEGILTDGDMDFPLSNILDALERWIAFLETGEPDEVYELAIRSIERVDFHVEADMDDMLATPEMAAELERIRRALTTG